jgi:hypothetical protein
MEPVMAGQTIAILILLWLSAQVPLAMVAGRVLARAGGRN